MGENIWWVTLNNSIIIYNSNGSNYFLMNNFIHLLKSLLDAVSSLHVVSISLSVQ